MLLRRARIGDIGIVNAPPKEGSKKEKQYFSPHPNLSSGVGQNLMVSDVVEVVCSSFTLKA